MVTNDKRRVLEIYVAGNCLGCDTARAMATGLRARMLPDLDIHLIDLGTPGASRPHAVFAIPTYLLDGRVLSLGNPETAWLLDHLTTASSDSPV